MLGLRLAFSVLLVALWAFSTVALGATSSEKGPRCSDGIDNDGDTLVDGNDPDCSGEPQFEVFTAVINGYRGVVDLATGAVCEDDRTLCPPGLYLANNTGSKLHALYTGGSGEASLQLRAFRGVPFHEVTAELVNQVGPNHAQFVVAIEFDDTIVVDTGNGTYKIGFAQCLVPFGSYLPEPMPWCEDTITPVEKMVISFSRIY